MVNEMRANMPPPQPFNWELEYGPLWSGSNDTAFWLAPEPDDIICIDGVRAPLREHKLGNAKHWAGKEELKKACKDARDTIHRLTGLQQLRSTLQSSQQSQGLYSNNMLSQMQNSIQQLGSTQFPGIDWPRKH